MMTETEVNEQIHRVVAKLAPNRDVPVSAGTRLIHELGFYSLTLLELAVEIEETFDLPPLDDSEGWEIETVADISHLVISLLAIRGER